MNANVPQSVCEHCFATRGLAALTSVPNTLSDNSRRESFGDYELQEEIARGGMGVVWKARQLSLNRTVALKMILSGHLASADEVKRFRTEAEAAARLQHPNIVTVHAVGEHMGQQYFSMDYIEGQSLAELIFHGPLPPPRAAKYLHAIAQAIDYAHQHGVVHRDLKPSNVLIDQSDQPRVTDFGLAKLTQSDSNLTHSGAVMGTPNYMSPEQAAGRTREVGPPTDIYSLGAILYELLTGRPPFQAATPLDTMRQLLEADPASPRWVNPNIPVDLETICLKCLEKDPQRRFHSARQLADDLAHFLRHEPITARPATRLDRLCKWARRKPASAALVIFSIVVVLSAAVAAAWYAGTLREHAGQLNDRLHLALVEQARAERLLGNRTAALQRVADAAALKRTPELRTEAIQAIALTGLRHVCDAPMGSIAVSQFSPNGKFLAVGGDGFVTLDWPGAVTNAWQNHVRVYETANGKLLAMLPWALEAGPFSFSPDSHLLALPHRPYNTLGELALYEADSAKIIARVPAFGAPRFSPDGTWFAVQQASNVTVWKFASNPVQISRADLPLGKDLFPAAIYNWVGRDELLLQHLPGEGRGRLFQWNVASATTTHPLPDSAYLRDAGGIPHSPSGGKLRLDAETVMAVSPDAATALTRMLRDTGAPQQITVRHIPSGTNVANVELASGFPDLLLPGPGGHILVFPDLLERGRFRIYDVIRNQFLAGVGEPGAYLIPSFEHIYHSTNVSSSGTLSSGPITVHYQTRQILTRSSPKPSMATPWLAPARNMDPLGTLLATEVYVSERSVSLWEIQSGRRLLSLPNSSQPVWSPDGRWLALTTRGMIPIQGGGGFSSGDIAQVWEVVRGVPSYRLPNATDSISFNHDGTSLAVGGPLWGTLLWDVSKVTGGMLAPNSRKMEEYDIVFTASRSWLLNHHRRRLVGSLSQFSPYPGTEKPFSIQDASWLLTRAVSPDGTRLLLACSAHSWMTNAAFTGPHYQLWDMLERRRLALWPHPDFLSSNRNSGFTDGPVIFSPDGKLFASGCLVNRGIEIWDAHAGKRLHALYPPGVPVMQPVSTPNVFARAFRTLFFPNRPYTPPLIVPPFMEFSVKAIAFSPDSRLVISASENRATIRDVQSGAELFHCLTKSNILSLAITRDILATGDETGEIRLWRLSSGDELARWPAHSAALTALAYSPDGTTLASGARDATLKLWNLPALRRDLATFALDW